MLVLDLPNCYVHNCYVLPTDDHKGKKTIITSLTFSVTVPYLVIYLFNLILDCSLMLKHCKVHGAQLNERKKIKTQQHEITVA